jgi:hypothetical protein
MQVRNKHNIGLIEYIRRCHNKYLNTKYYILDDCVQETLITLYEYRTLRPGNIKRGRYATRSGKPIFRRIIEADLVPPKGTKLYKLLNSIIYTTKLNFLQKENKEVSYDQRKFLTTYYNTREQYERKAN